MSAAAVRSETLPCVAAVATCDAASQPWVPARAGGDEAYVLGCDVVALGRPSDSRHRREREAPRSTPIRHECRAPVWNARRTVSTWPPKWETSKRFATDRIHFVLSWFRWWASFLLRPSTVREAGRFGLNASPRDPMPTSGPDHRPSRVRAASNGGTGRLPTRSGLVLTACASMFSGASPDRSWS